MHPLAERFVSLGVMIGAFVKERVKFYSMAQISPFNNSPAYFYPIFTSIIYTHFENSFHKVVRHSATPQVTTQGSFPGEAACLMTSGQGGVRGQYIVHPPQKKGTSIQNCPAACKYRKEEKAIKPKSKTHRQRTSARPGRRKEKVSFCFESKDLLAAV
jgi:hypothetical protein